MSGVTSFLKTIGESLANGALAYVNLPPVFATKPAPAQVLTVVAELGQITAAAMNIEGIGKTTGLTGAQKMLALQPQVVAILKASLALGHNPIEDNTLFQKGSDEIAQGVVDCLNSFKRDKVPS